MADFPDAITSPRQVVNRPGVVYDANDTKTLFAEDLNNANAEIVAIETELGANPKGSFDSIADAVDYFSVVIASILSRLLFLIDFFEYASDAIAQAAFVTNATFSYTSDVLTGGTASTNVGTAANAVDNSGATLWQGNTSAYWKYDFGAGVTKQIQKFTAQGWPDGGGLLMKNFTIKGSNDNSNWTTVYTGVQANNNSVQSFTFSNSVAYRYYKVEITNNYNATYPTLAGCYEFEMMEGSISLQDYSEATLKTQGSYALKAIALITSSLNKTFTKTFSPVKNLAGKTTLYFDIRASRTGSNIKIGIHDSGGTTTEITPNIAVADAWQTVAWDISAVADANKDAIDSLIITITNSDAANTFYLDNMFV